MDPDKYIKMIVQIRDIIPLEENQIIDIQKMTEKEKTKLIVVMNQVIRSLVYVL